MMMISSRTWIGGAAAASLLSVLAGCGGPPSNTAPAQVQSSPPTVSYQYRGDQGLAEATQTAGHYCSQYQATAQIAAVNDGADGSKTATFNCVGAPPMQNPPGPVVIAAPPASATPAVTPGTRYTYYNDQQGAALTQSAMTYCQNVGQQRAASTIYTNADGSRTITFTCASP